MLHAVCCACDQLALLLCSRFADLRVFEVMTNTAASLVKVAQKAHPEVLVAAATGNCLRCIQLARHPSLITCVSPRLSSSCLV